MQKMTPQEFYEKRLREIDEELNQKKRQLELDLDARKKSIARRLLKGEIKSALDAVQEQQTAETETSEQCKQAEADATAHREQAEQMREVMQRSWDAARKNPKRRPKN